MAIRTLESREAEPSALAAIRAGITARFAAFMLAVTAATGCVDYADETAQDVSGSVSDVVGGDGSNSDAYSDSDVVGGDGSNSDAYSDSDVVGGDTGSDTPDTGSDTTDTGSDTPDTGSDTTDTGSDTPDAGNPNAICSKLEVQASEGSMAISTGQVGPGGLPLYQTFALPGGAANVEFTCDEMTSFQVISGDCGPMQVTKLGGPGQWKCEVATELGDVVVGKKLEYSGDSISLTPDADECPSIECEPK